MKRIIYTVEGGVVAIVIPSDEFNGTMDELARATVPNGIGYGIVDDIQIPTDRTFRMAWEHDASMSSQKIKINMVKAKDIAHSKRRTDRDNLLSPLDRLATILSQMNQAEAQRQIIRDADAKKQIDIDNATTTEQLKTIIDTPLV